MLKIKNAFFLLFLICIILNFSQKENVRSLGRNKVGTCTSRYFCLTDCKKKEGLEKNKCRTICKENNQCR